MNVKKIECLAYIRVGSFNCFFDSNFIQSCMLMKYDDGGDDDRL
jgi:hypothetical protein